MPKTCWMLVHKLGARKAEIVAMLERSGFFAQASVSWEPVLSSALFQVERPLTSCCHRSTGRPSAAPTGDHLRFPPFQVTFASLGFESSPFSCVISATESRKCTYSGKGYKEWRSPQHFPAEDLVACEQTRLGSSPQSSWAHYPMCVQAIDGRSSCKTDEARRARRQTAPARGLAKYER